MIKTFLFATAAAIFLVGCGPTNDAESQADLIESQASSEVDAMLDANRVERKWSYHTSRDEMRGSNTKFAEIPSTDIIVSGWPYTPAPMTMTLREGPQGFDIYLQISGQFTCYSGGDRIAVKFDDGPIEQYSCTNADGGATEVAFVGSEQRFLSKLRSAKKVTLEVPIFQVGRQQVSFDVSGLEWE